MSKTKDKLNVPAQRFLRRRDILALPPGLLAAVFLEKRRAHAAVGSAKRLLIMYTPNGAHDGRWTPTGTETNFALAPMLSPLSAIQKDVVLVSGLVHAQHNDSPGAGDQHDSGVYQMLTGTKGIKEGSSAWAGGPSVDQTIGASLGQAMPRRTLELGVYAAKNGFPKKFTSRNVISYQGAGKPAVPLLDPWASIAGLFEGITANRDPASALAISRRRKSVLDFLRRDASKLRSEIRGAEAQRLDVFLHSIEDVEKTLLAPSSSSQQCAAPSLAAKPAGQQYNDEFFAAYASAQAKIAIAALLCEVTPVVTLMFAIAGGGEGDPTFNFAPVNVSGQHHELSHKADQTSKDAFDKIHRWYAQQFVNLVQALRSTDDSNGDMLSNTLVWWTTDLGDAASHNATNVQQVLAEGV